MAKAAPASAAAFRSDTEHTVPAPTVISGTDLAIAAMACSATGVRIVTSITWMPPRTSARATSAATAASVNVTTGMTGDKRRNFSIAPECVIASAPYCESCVLEEIVHVRDAAEVEIARNGVLQAGGGEAEVQGRLVIQPTPEAVQHPGCERVTAADSVDDPTDRIGPRGDQPVTRHKLT